ncbi:DNA replication and repair protein RecO [Geothermobacter ehrlichii]|uniref:DNA repair protein RecO n=1 Tax=Geothermobacter ehrlichii TaxID=213224 RepID=A0A5D3WI43_9BACT|nr:DNA repair protein RecO [Geothermobacter ehrlichii]TYO96395.1 DNA replication and repair protein RecO [Geothermobacter ehrlichii]
MQQPRTTDAIILRHTDYGEADRIVSFFTPDDGLVKGFARGARKSRRRFGAAFEPFSLVRLVWRPRPGSALVSLREAELVSLRAGLRNDLKAMALAGYACELVEMLFGEGGCHPEVFRLLDTLLAQLERNGARAEYRLLLELRLLRLSGHEPHLLHCAVCGGSLPDDARFSARHDGSLCSACAVPGARPVALTTLGSLARCRETAVDRFDGIRLGTRTLGEGAPLVTEALEQMLPHPLKSRVFLDHLGPLPPVSAGGETTRNP